MARDAEVEQRVETLVEPVVNRLGFALVHVACGRRGRRPHVRLTIDRADGVTVEDCESVSREVEAVLDAAGLVGDDYVLEVESPGLDRVLQTEREFRHFAGRPVEVRTYAPVDGRKRFVGTLVGLEEGAVVLDVDGERRRIPRDQVARVRLHVDW